jgi:hypothetical protein
MEGKGSTMLMNAAWSGRINVMELLLEHRASIDLHCNGRTALLGAMQGAMQGLRSRLAEDDSSRRESGTDGRPNPVERKLLPAELRPIQTLLDAAADPNLVCQSQGAPATYLSPLLFAAQLGDASIVEMVRWPPTRRQT